MLAREQRDAGKFAEAEATCRRALSIDRSNAVAHRVLGTILQAQEHGLAAIASFQEAISLDPGSAKAFKQLANALGEEGLLSEAIDADRKALELCPRYAWALYHLAQLKTFSSGDPELMALEALARDDEGLEPLELIAVLFGLAKAYDDLGDYDRSFENLRQANALRRDTVEYDVAAVTRAFDQIAAVFDSELLDQFADSGSPDDLPVLIVGMPRSGTSLIEQILASHPAVHGAGELQDLEELAGAVALLCDRALGFPDGVPHLSSEDLGRLGQGYVERLRHRAPRFRRVTDKNSLNFCYLGLARLIAPRSHVIHCARDPVDTCLSCYRAFFETIDFACDLDELGQYYRGYTRLMDHWRAVLPRGWMLEVRYEDLVADVEGEARRIVTHCGLEWDDACLSFDTTERSVRTASFAQVRKPVYRSSVARWRHYEQHLGPLIGALELETD